MSWSNSLKWYSAQIKAFEVVISDQYDLNASCAYFSQSCWIANYFDYSGVGQSYLIDSASSALWTYIHSIYCRPFDFVITVVKKSGLAMALSIFWVSSATVDCLCSLLRSLKVCNCVENKIKSWVMMNAANPTIRTYQCCLFDFSWFNYYLCFIIILNSMNWYYMYSLFQLNLLYLLFNSKQIAVTIIIIDLQCHGLCPYRYRFASLANLLELHLYIYQIARS